VLYHIAKPCNFCISAAGERSKDLEDWRSPQGKVWEVEAVCVAVRALDMMSGLLEATPSSSTPPLGTQTGAGVNNGQTAVDDNGSASSSANAALGLDALAAAGASGMRARIRPAWSKHTPKVMMLCPLCIIGCLRACGVRLFGFFWF
jgi:hypothetical protein